MGTEIVGKSFQADSITIDTNAKITETAEYLTVEPVTIAREGVFPYEDGRAFKPGSELQKGAEVARTYLAWDHPPLKVITKPAEIKGFADNVHFVKDGAGSRVKARLTFNKKKLTVDQQELIRSKARRDVSVGFYYEEDRTPGKWNGQEYDYVQREFVYDHVASVDHGRCTYPQCGIGVDVGVHIGNDPYPNEHSCRIVDPGEFRPDSFRRIKSGNVSLIIGKRKGERKTSLQAIRYAKNVWTLANARSNCQQHGGSFEAAKSDQEDMNNMKKEDQLQPTFEPTDVNLRVFEVEGESCGSCIFFEYSTSTCRIVKGPVSTGVVCDEFTGKATIETMVRAMQGNAAVDQLTAEELKGIPKEKWGYTPSDNRSEWKLPMPDRAHCVAALQALQGARGGVQIPRGDLPGVKRKVCAAANKYGIKSQYCGTADANDAVALMQRLLTVPSLELVDMHRSLHASDDFDKDSMLHHALLHALKKRR